MDLTAEAQIIHHMSAANQRAERCHLTILDKALALKERHRRRQIGLDRLHLHRPVQLSDIFVELVQVEVAGCQSGHRLKFPRMNRLFFEFLLGVHIRFRNLVVAGQDALVGRSLVEDILPVGSQLIHVDHCHALAQNLVQFHRRKTVRQILPRPFSIRKQPGNLLQIWFGVITPAGQHIPATRASALFLHP